MPGVVIADFSGMMPLRDPMLLPDNNAQYAKNTWLYKGAIRGYRISDHIIQLKRPTTSKQIYRIPLNESLDDWVNSLWLEFPDPYMNVVRPPVVGDQYNRYYFFPSEDFVDDGSGWFSVPFYAPLANIQAGGPYYILGIPTPGVAPLVTPAPILENLVTTGPTPAGDTVLNFASTDSIGVGMEIIDSTSTTLTRNTSAPSPTGTYTLYFASTAGLSVGMEVLDLTTTTINETATLATTPTNTVISLGATTGIQSGMQVSDTTTTTFNLTANGAISLNATAVPFASTAGIVIGMGVADLTKPSVFAAGTVVTGINPGVSITINIPCPAGSAGASDTIQFTNSNQIPSGTTVVWVSPTQVAISNPVTGAGVAIGDNIQFTSSNSIVHGATINAISSGAINLSINAINGGVFTGDQIQFSSGNAIVAGTTVVWVTPTQIAMSNPAISGGVLSGDTVQFSTFTEVRSYVYTYVSAYGEEGPPSPATVAGGGPTGIWTITAYSPSNTDILHRNLTKLRIYRTVTDSTGGATFYQIVELPIGGPSAPVVYNDSALATDITNNLILASTLFTGPPAGLQGVVMMANGIAAGWANEREIWFSAAFLPHAWPATYALTVDFNVVGLAAVGSSLSIITEGQPFIATGTTPDTMTIGKVTSNEPGISRGGIFPAGEGVYYPSPNGLILLNTSGTINTTQFSMEKEFWESLTPEQWASGRTGLSYTALIKGASSSVDGVVLDHLEKNVPCALVASETEPGETLLNLYWDELSGQIFVVHTGGIHWWFPPSSGELLPWTWKSKKFRVPWPQVFKAFTINFDVPPEVTITPPTPQSRNNNQAQTFNPLTQYLIVRVYGDGNQIVVREVVQNGEVLLIPDGQKYTFWEIQFEGQIYMRLFKMAQSVKELRKL